MKFPPLHRARQKLLKKEQSYQSPSSSSKISFTDTPNTCARRKASTVEGLNFPCSIATIVCRLTRTRSARSSCVIRSFALSTRKLFFIAQITIFHPHGNLKDYHIQRQDAQQPSHRPYFSKLHRRQMSRKQEIHRGIEHKHHRIHHSHHTQSI